MSVTETILIPPYGHTLAATLREINANGIASRIELKPQTVFAGNTEWDSTDLSAWTQTNSANADVIDANTTRPGRLHVNLNATAVEWINGDRSAVFVNQSFSGDFDIYTDADVGNMVGNHFIGFVAQSSTVATTWERLILLCVPTLSDTYFVFRDRCIADARTTVGGFGNEVNTPFFGAKVWLRLVRIGTNMTCYYSTNAGFTWNACGASFDQSTFPSALKVGIVVGNANTANKCVASVGPIRNWKPYVTTSPVAALVLDSGVPGAIWTPSTFAALENPPTDPFGIQSILGYGTFKYRLAAGESNPPTLSGAALTEAQVQALSPITGRYLNIEVTFISANGYELASWAGAKINRTIPHFLLVHPGMAGMRG